LAALDATFASSGAAGDCRSAASCWRAGSPAGVPRAARASSTPWRTLCRTPSRIQSNSAKAILAPSASLRVIGGPASQQGDAGPSPPGRARGRVTCFALFSGKELGRLERKRSPERRHQVTWIEPGTSGTTRSGLARLLRTRCRTTASSCPTGSTWSGRGRLLRSPPQK
jgi:hypothetical protein